MSHLCSRKSCVGYHRRRRGSLSLTGHSEGTHRAWRMCMFGQFMKNDDRKNAYTENMWVGTKMRGWCLSVPGRTHCFSLFFEISGLLPVSPSVHLSVLQTWIMIAVSKFFSTKTDNFVKNRRYVHVCITITCSFLDWLMANVLAFFDLRFQIN